MAKILFNDPGNSSKDNKPEMDNKPVVSPGSEITNVTVLSNLDDFAIFPEWDVVPPSPIINPRIKRKI